MLSTTSMSEDALIRLENLKRLKHDAAFLSAKVGGRISYWHDLLQGNKSFGEKAARKIEAALGLSRGQLDIQSGVIPPDYKLNQQPAPAEQGPAAINNGVTDIASRRSVDGVDNALRVLADAINQLAVDNRDGVAGLLSSFGRNPSAPGTYAALLALLDSGNARRQADPLPKSSSLGGR